MEFDPTQAYITLEDGTVIQVLNPEGDYDDHATEVKLKEVIADAYAQLALDTVTSNDA